jgi:hypothetical protein
MVLSMRTIKGLLLTFGLGLVLVGCGPTKTYTGKTVDKFVGKVTHNGQPVSFPADQEAQLTLYHQSGQQWSIRLQEDGTFDIGWMPVGKYAVMLERQQGAKKRGSGISRYSIPDGLTIEDGQTEYVIELGKGFKP